ncbi:MAG: hypothetical protein U9N19_02580 [Thermodesulfobacteriota bacterium]|nr:hypothetical protein [Thermodesulfobacteriota bacterium]
MEKKSIPPIVIQIDFGPLHGTGAFIDASGFDVEIFVQRDSCTK